MAVYLVIIFIHTIGVTSSYLLPLIRSTLQLNSRWSDQEILQTFTIALPGHIYGDKPITWQLIRDIFISRMDELAENQKNIAQTLLLNHPTEIISTLKDKKITVVGHGFGAAAALNILFYKFSYIRRIILIGGGNTFNSFSLWWKILTMSVLTTRSRQFLTKAIVKTSHIWRKAEYSLFSENLRRQGYFSGLQLMKSFNAQALFRRLSLDDQLKVLRIPVLLIKGEHDEYVSTKSALSLTGLFSLEKSAIQLKNKTTYIDSTPPESQFSVKFYPESGHFLPETDLNKLCEDIQLFLKRK